MSDMSEENQRLDEAIVAVLRANFYPMKTVQIEVATAPTEDAPPGKHYRALDRALQRMRKAGRIRHTKPRGWALAEVPAASPAIVVAATSDDANAIAAWCLENGDDSYHSRARAIHALSRATVVDRAAIVEMAERLDRAHSDTDWQTVGEVQSELQRLLGAEDSEGRHHG